MTIRRSAKSSLSDEEIARKIIENKDTAAFGGLYDRYADKVYAKCMSFTHERQAAEDLAHDIFLKLYLKLGDFRFQAKFSTWLYSITYHECVEYARKTKKAIKDQEAYRSEKMHQATGEESEAALLELKLNKLKKLLEKISPEEKALLLMKYQDGASIEEITNHTQLSESAVKMRLKRAKAKIVSLSRTGAIALILIFISWILFFNNG